MTQTVQSTPLTNGIASVTETQYAPHHPKVRHLTIYISSEVQEGAYMPPSTLELGSINCEKLRDFLNQQFPANPIKEAVIASGGVE